MTRDDRAANSRAACVVRNTRTASGPSSVSSRTTLSSNSPSVMASSSTTTASDSASQPRPMVPTRNSASTGITRGLRSPTRSDGGGIGVPNLRWISSSRAPIRSARICTCCFSSITLMMRASWTAWR
ncbi:Uncharacterised protein [Mycobacteroides abscessus subsp. abscessus]|nr:Uncharacterised protein [Mycobacteroides abscessus subsp. abscessus]